MYSSYMYSMPIRLKKKQKTKNKRKKKRKKKVFTVFDNAEQWTVVLV